MHDWYYMAALLLAILLPAPWLGRYMYAVYESPGKGLLARFERHLFGRCLGGEQPQDWRAYAASLLLFNLVGFVVLFALLMLQGWLPLNPQQLPGLSWDLALNTAISFVTNTNWQAYSGEASLSYLSQMLGLGVQNFVSAGTGMAVAVALFRGLSQGRNPLLGNFYQDLYRGVVYILLPLSLVLALLLVHTGVPQNFHAYLQLQGLDHSSQLLPGGPAASQIAIKQLGTNGGGFFGVNSAHPLENPTLWSNFLQTVSILLIPAALVFSFGRYVRDRRQAWAILACMLLLFLLGLAVTLWAEHQSNPALAGLPLLQDGNWEGKETRFGIDLSAFWATATSAASNGSVNSMHDSFMPLAGMVPMLNIMLGEVIFGGVGAGMYGMLLFVLLAVFLGGLMIGRTPEYLGKKIEAKEIQWALLAMLTMPLGILVFSSLSVAVPGALASLSNPGPHGLSQLLYAYSSATGNNGSAFAGFAANTPYHNCLLGLAMVLGRYGVILPVLAIAGLLATKPQVHLGDAAFPTHGPLFVSLLTLSILLIAGLSFFPVLALGPLAEHLSLLQGSRF